jgi:hypothetical protein
MFTVALGRRENVISEQFLEIAKPLPNPSPARRGALSMTAFKVAEKLNREKWKC